jgi:hypothetical protein
VQEMKHACAWQRDLVHSVLLTVGASSAENKLEQSQHRRPKGEKGHWEWPRLGASGRCSRSNGEKKVVGSKNRTKKRKAGGSKNEMNSRKILRWTRARAQNRGPKTRSSSYKEQKTNSTNKMRKGFLHRIKNRVQHEISVHGTLLLI